MREAMDPSTPRGTSPRRTATASPPVTDDLRTAGAGPDDGDAMRELARHLAEVADTPALLRILLDAVVRQCRATGASVSHVAGGDAVIISAVGSVAPMRGAALAIADSIAERAITQREPVSERIAAE